MGLAEGQTCADLMWSKSWRSVCRAACISSITVVPWRLSAVLSCTMSHGTKVPELVEAQAATYVSQLCDI